jgi:hypothetical protein
VSVDGPGREQLRALAARLKEAGTEGKGLRRELLGQLEEAAKPLARKIASPEHLAPYMPDRYAEVLAGDLSVRVQRVLAGDSPRVSVVARARAHKRKIAQVEDGLLVHPVFAQGARRTWNWKNGRQTAGVKAGFFTDPCEAAVPDIREHALKAMSETARKVAGGR